MPVSWEWGTFVQRWLRYLRKLYICTQLGTFMYLADVLWWKSLMVNVRFCLSPLPQSSVDNHQVFPASSFFVCVLGKLWILSPSFCTFLSLAWPIFPSIFLLCTREHSSFGPLLSLSCGGRMKNRLPWIEVWGMLPVGKTQAFYLSLGEWWWWRMWGQARVCRAHQ